MRIAAIVFGVTSAALLGSLAALQTTGERVLRLEHEQDNQRDALLAIDDLFSAVQDAETGQRGFLITGDESYLTPFNDGRAKIPDAFARLNENAALNDPTFHITELRRLFKVATTGVSGVRWR